jgi:hypothetical protein
LKSGERLRRRLDRRLDDGLLDGFLDHSVLGRLQRRAPIPEPLEDGVGLPEVGRERGFARRFLPDRDLALEIVGGGFGLRPRQLHRPRASRSCGSSFSGDGVTGMFATGCGRELDSSLWTGSLRVAYTAMTAMRARTPAPQAMRTVVPPDPAGSASLRTMASFTEVPWPAAGLAAFIRVEESDASFCLRAEVGRQAAQMAFPET